MIKSMKEQDEEIKLLTTTLPYNISKGRAHLTVE